MNKKTVAYRSSVAHSGDVRERLLSVDGLVDLHLPCAPEPLQRVLEQAPLIY
jgi:hypothetical protein